MHVMDAIAAVMILFFFAISGFDTGEGSDWNRYETEIGAEDLSYTLKKTGNIGYYVENGKTGNIKRAFEGVTKRNYDVSGAIKGVPPNLEVGWYKRPSEIKNVAVTEVTTGDQCYTEVQNTLQKKSAPPIIRTQPSAIQNNNDGITLYSGDYTLNKDLVSEVDYDSIWIDRNDNCNFNKIYDPKKPGEIFEWGSGSFYEFKETNINENGWAGFIELAEATQMHRIQDSMDQEINNVKTHVEFDSFRINDQTKDKDFLVFPKKETIEVLQDSGRQQAINNKINEKPVLFLANLNQSLVEDTFLQRNGFRWKDLGYVVQGPSCTTNNHEIDKPCSRLEPGFSSSQTSQNVRNFMEGQEIVYEDLSLYPEGSVTIKGQGATSFGKTIYLRNFAYREISQNRVNKALTPENFASSEEPYTRCDNVTTGNLDFPDTNGNLETLKIASTQLGTSNTYCSQNNRALYIDKDNDGDFNQDSEGPYRDGEKLEIKALTYQATILPASESGCSSDDCAGFSLDENAKVNLFTINSDKNVGRAPYENPYDPEDRKAISSLIYTMAGDSQIEGNFDSTLSTNTYSVTNGEPYRIDVRWSQ